MSKFNRNFIFRFRYWNTQVLFMGPLMPLFWTPGDIGPGFQTRVDFFTCFLACVILKFTSGVIPVDCREIAWQPSLFGPHTWRCVYKEWWRFGARTHDRSCGKHSTVYHSATSIFVEKLKHKTKDLESINYLLKTMFNRKKTRWF